MQSHNRREMLWHTPAHAQSRYSLENLLQQDSSSNDSGYMRVCKMTESNASRLCRHRGSRHQGNGLWAYSCTARHRPRSMGGVAGAPLLGSARAGARKRLRSGWNRRQHGARMLACGSCVHECCHTVSCAYTYASALLCR